MKMKGNNDDTPKIPAATVTTEPTPDSSRQSEAAAEPQSPISHLLSPVPDPGPSPAPPASPIKRRQRTGTVARLPKEVRQRINYMLDDGLSYAQIIEQLGEL